MAGLAGRLGDQGGAHVGAGVLGRQDPVLTMTVRANRSVRIALGQELSVDAGLVLLANFRMTAPARCRNVRMSNARSRIAKPQDLMAGSGRGVAVDAGRAGLTLARCHAVDARFVRANGTFEPNIVLLG